MIRHIKVSHLGILVAAVFVASMSSFFVLQGILSDWYRALLVPLYMPSGFTSSVVWMVLFILITVAGILSWHAPIDKKARDRVRFLFIAIAFLNFYWRFLFFVTTNLGLAAFDAIVLFFVSLALMLKLYRWRKTVAYLLLPAVVWLAFAAYLNLVIWAVNRV